MGGTNRPVLKNYPASSGGDLAPRASSLPKPDPGFQNPLNELIVPDPLDLNGEELSEPQRLTNEYLASRLEGIKPVEPEIKEGEMKLGEMSFDPSIPLAVVPFLAIEISRANFLEEHIKDLKALNHPVGLCEEVKQITQHLGLKVKLEEDVEKTLQNLARSVARQIEITGVEFYEAEYLYLLTETLQKYPSVEPAKLVQLYEQGLYDFRREMRAVYAEPASLCAKELLLADLEDREGIIDKYFFDQTKGCGGDREVFKHAALGYEASELSRRTRELSERIVAFSEGDLRHILTYLTHSKNLQEFNKNVQVLLKGLVYKKYADEIKMLEYQISAHQESCDSLWEKFDHKIEDQRCLSTFGTIKNNSIVDEALSPQLTTVLIEAAKKRIEQNSLAPTIYTRYGDFWTLLCPDDAAQVNPVLLRRKEAEAARFCNSEELSQGCRKLRVADLSHQTSRTDGVKFDSRIGIEAGVLTREQREEHVTVLEAIAKQYDELLKRKIVLQTSIAALNKELSSQEVSNENRDKYEKRLSELTFELKETEKLPKTLTPAQIETILEPYGSGRKFLELVDKHQDLYRRIGGFLAIRGMSEDQVQPIFEAIGKKTTAARKEAIEGLVKSEQAYFKEKQALEEKVGEFRKFAVASEAAKHAEEELHVLVQSRELEREKLIALIGDSSVLRGYLSKVKNNIPVPDRLEAIVLQGDLSQMVAAELNAAKSDPAPLGAIFKILSVRHQGLNYRSISEQYEKIFREKIENRFAPEDQQQVQLALIGANTIGEDYPQHFNRKLNTLLAKIADSNSKSPEDSYQKIRQLLYANNDIVHNASVSSLANLTSRLEKDEELKAYLTQKTLRRSAVSNIQNGEEVVVAVERMGQILERGATSEYVASLMLEDVAALVSKNLRNKDTLNSAPVAFKRYVTESLPQELVEKLLARIPELTPPKAPDVLPELRDLAQELFPQNSLVLSNAEKPILAAKYDTTARANLFHLYEQALLNQWPKGEVQTSADHKTVVSQAVVSEEKENTSEETAQDKLNLRLGELNDELRNLAQYYGPLIPLKEVKISDDPWIQKIQELAEKDYTARISPIYEEIEQIVFNNPNLGVDITFFSGGEREVLRWSRVRSYIHLRVNEEAKVNQDIKVVLKLTPDEALIRGYNLNRITSEELEREGVFTVLGKSATLEYLNQSRAIPLKENIKSLEVKIASEYPDPTKLSLQQIAAYNKEKLELDRVYRDYAFYTSKKEVEKLKDELHLATDTIRKHSLVKNYLDELIKENLSWDEINKKIGEEHKECFTIVSADLLKEYVGQRKLKKTLRPLGQIQDELATLYAKDGLDREFPSRQDQFKTSRYTSDYKECLKEVQEFCKLSYKRGFLADPARKHNFPGFNEDLKNVEQQIAKTEARIKSIAKEIPGMEDTSFLAKCSSYYITQGYRKWVATYKPNEDFSAMEQIRIGLHNSASFILFDYKEVGEKTRKLSIRPETKNAKEGVAKLSLDLPDINGGEVEQMEDLIAKIDPTFQKPIGRLLPTYREVMKQVMELEKEFPGTINSPSMITKSIEEVRYAHVFAWIRENAREKSWDEISKTLMERGVFDKFNINITDVKRAVYAARTDEITTDLRNAWLRKGYYVDPARKHEIKNTAGKLAEAEQTITELEEKLKNAVGDMPDMFNSTHLGMIHGEYFRTGFKNWQKEVENHREQGRADAQKEEDEKEYTDRLVDILEKAGKASVHFDQFIEDNTIPRIYGLSHAFNSSKKDGNDLYSYFDNTPNNRDIRSWLRSKMAPDSFWATYDHYAGEKAFEIHNDYNKKWAGSRHGTNAEFAGIGDVEAFLADHPWAGFEYASNALINPIFDTIDLTKAESFRAFRNNYDPRVAGYENYNEFAKTMETDPYYKNANRAFLGLEVAANAAAVYFSGGASAPSAAVRLSRVAKMLGVSTAFSATTAIGEQLVENDSGFNWERFSDKTLQGNARSAEFITVSKQLGNIAMRTKFSGAIPQTEAELEALRRSNPARFAQYEAGLARSESSRRFFDVVDAQSDFGSGAATFDKTLDAFSQNKPLAVIWRKAIGSSLLTGTAATDALEGVSEGEFKNNLAKKMPSVEVDSTSDAPIRDFVSVPSANALLVTSSNSAQTVYKEVVQDPGSVPNNYALIDPLGGQTVVSIPQASDTAPLQVRETSQARNQSFVTVVNMARVVYDRSVMQLKNYGVSDQEAQIYALLNMSRFLYDNNYSSRFEGGTIVIEPHDGQTTPPAIKEHEARDFVMKLPSPS